MCGNMTGKTTQNYGYCGTIILGYVLGDRTSRNMPMVYTKINDMISLLNKEQLSVTQLSKASRKWHLLGPAYDQDTSLKDKQLSQVSGLTIRGTVQGVVAVAIEVPHLQQLYTHDNYQVTTSHSSQKMCPYIDLNTFLPMVICYCKQLQIVPSYCKQMVSCYCK